MRRRRAPGAADRLGRLASLVVLPLLLLETGCANPPTLAEIRALRPEPTRILGPRGALDRRQIQLVLQGLREEGRGTDILDRHLGIEQAVADTPLTIGNRAALLVDGPPTFRAMFAAIRAARHHVNAEFFIVDPNGIGREFADLLLAKRAEGVEVNLVYDAVGSDQTPASYFERLRAGGVNLLEFHPIDLFDTGPDGWSPNDRDHRKILIVDGEVAFTGGINISTVYGDTRSPAPDPARGEGPPGVKWRDTSVELEGPVVAELQRLFLRHWAEHGGGPLREADFFPARARAGDDAVRVIGSSPEHHPDAFYAALISAIESAERRVHVTQSYFAPPPAELRALADAARRGIDVTLILAGPTDEPLVVAAGQADYGELLAAGVTILERQGVVLHSKTVVIDGVWSSVGSSNLDYRSVLYNDEADAIVVGASFGEAMEGMFADDLSHSAPVDAARWARRGVGERVRDEQRVRPHLDLLAHELHRELERRRARAHDHGVAVHHQLGRRSPDQRLLGHRDAGLLVEARLERVARAGTGHTARVRDASSGGELAQVAADGDG